MRKCLLVLICFGIWFGSLGVATAEEEYMQGYIRVHVTAENETTGEFENIEEATAYLYVGEDVRATALTDENGYAELSLRDVLCSESGNISVSAQKEIGHGKAQYGTAREALYEYYPTHVEDSEYYRYRMELHSEWIDADGNWRGQAVTPKVITEQADVVFVIDATKSMSAEIAGVKENLSAYAQQLESNNINVRFSLIEYFDTTYGEETKVHTYNGSCWFSDVDTFIEELDSIVLGDGGDDDETLLDALGYLTDESVMKWRSNAERFAYVLTDTGYKTDNSHRYKNLEEAMQVLAEQEICTSVITTRYFSDVYEPLCEGTGGQLANIYAEDFEAELYALADSMVERIAAEVELVLSEPRMYINLSVCYLAPDEQTQTEEYDSLVRSVMKVYANHLAQATDAHVLVDNVLVYSTDEQLDFYDTTNLASMADIRIETSAYDTTKSYSNSHVAGFFRGTMVLSTVDEVTRRTFQRVQISGTWAGNSRCSILGDQEYYTAIMLHETGHYLFGFRDEYMDGNRSYWNPRYHDNYGMMDQAQDDVEISKATADYAYITESSSFEQAAQELHSVQSWTYKEACEDTLAELMTDNTKLLQIIGTGATEGNVRYTYTEDYVAVYTKAPSDHRRAEYAFAALTDDDFMEPPILIVSSEGASISASEAAFLDKE